MDEAGLLLLIIFGGVIAIVAIPLYFKSKERERLHHTLRLAYERGQPVPPELIEVMQRGERPRPSAERDLRIGVILLAVALAMLTIGFATNDISDGHALRGMASAAAFPGFIGLAFLAFWAAKRGKNSDRLEG